MAALHDGAPTSVTTPTGDHGGRNIPPAAARTGVIDLVDTCGVMLDLKAADKQQVLAKLARMAGLSLGLDAHEIQAALTHREMLGSTALGHGVALPHGEVRGLRHSYGVLARLRPSIDFSAHDDEPVDLVFLLLVPAGSLAAHLGALAAISRRLRDTKATERMRCAGSATELYATLLD